MFQAQKKFGNKWDLISQLLAGRTDNVVKNHFYSTLRRELRKIIRLVNGERAAEPKEVSVSYMQELLKKHNMPSSVLENENITP